MTPICPIDMRGRFTAEVTHFQGQHVKDADKNIMKHLKEAGRLVRQSTTVHSYPFCWRSDTPLIYRAIPSWFVRVEHMTDELLASNARTYWVPDFVKEKRFGNWLREARDWAISRNRYWGTPIPLWVSDDGEEVVCIGSIEELCQLAGISELKDLHRERYVGRGCLTLFVLVQAPLSPSSGLENRSRQSKYMNFLIGTSLGLQLWLNLTDTES